MRIKGCYINRFLSLFSAFAFILLIHTSAAFADGTARCLIGIDKDNNGIVTYHNLASMFRSSGKIKGCKDNGCSKPSNGVSECRRDDVGFPLFQYRCSCLVKNTAGEYVPCPDPLEVTPSE